MGHLSKLQDKYRDKGLTVIGITGEDRRTNLRYMLHNDPGFTYKVAIGSAPGYDTPEFPWSVLIAPDGSVAWKGSPARMSANKDLKPLLAQVRDPTPAELSARTTKMLRFAESFVADELYVRAELALEAIVAKYPKSKAAGIAKARVKSMLVIEGAVLEYLVQQSIVKLVGGVDAPDPAGKRVKAKNAARAVTKLVKLAEKYEESAPRAARLALEWADLHRVAWE